MFLNRDRLNEVLRVFVGGGLRRSFGRLSERVFESMSFKPI